ncbi:YoaK family protein [Kocuria sp.]|uniref:YoaK family protein n=1 Tax=Kocuria sp. TaxID=1871328 RepID=UPI0026DF0AD5|nr:YoaK family protein [Kocuria sp.]MDO5367631.1 YoaK family protein [Kocuria sp.]
MEGYRLGERALAWYLSSITGFIDALGFLYLGGFFLSFMSGNTTRMTAAAVEGSWDVAWRAAGVMALFLTGVMIGSLISRVAHRRLPPTRPREAVLLFVCFTVSVASVWVALGHGLLAVLSLSFTVGAMNSIFERDGEVSISLTYMTGTLVKMSQRFVGAFFGGSHRAWLRYFILWLSLVIGAVLGGLCYVTIGIKSVWVVSALVLLGTTTALINRQRRRRLGLPV